MAAEDTGDDASIALLRRLRAGATVHFVHHVDVCSADPEDLVADLDLAPGSSVRYFYCVKKYKSTHGRSGGHRQRAIAAGDTCWHSEASAKNVKGSESGGGTACNLSYGRKDGRSFSRLGWCMMEYDDAATSGAAADHVLCKVYRSPRAQVKPTSAASKTAKRKAGGEHPEARPAKLFHEQDTFFTDDYAVPSMAAQAINEEQHLPSTQDGEFVETSYGLLPSDVAQVNVEDWIGGMEMFGGDEEQHQSSKPEQDEGSVKEQQVEASRSKTEDITVTVEDCSIAAETTTTTSGEASGVPATFTPQDDAGLLDDLKRDLQEQTLRMQQPHAFEPDLLSPRAAAMALACHHQESHWMMMQSFPEAYPFQLLCLLY